VTCGLAPAAGRVRHRASESTGRYGWEARMGIEDVTRFGAAVLLVGLAVLVALTGNRPSRAVPVPRSRHYSYLARR